MNKLKSARRQLNRFEAGGSNFNICHHVVLRKASLMCVSIEHQK